MNASWLPPAAAQKGGSCGGSRSSDDIESTTLAPVERFCASPFGSPTVLLAREKKDTIRMPFQVLVPFRSRPRAADVNDEQSAATAAAETVPLAVTSSSSSSTVPAPTTTQGVTGAAYTLYPTTPAAREMAARLMASKRGDAVLRSMPSNNKDSSHQKKTIGVYEWRAVPAAANAAWVDSVVRVYDSVVAKRPSGRCSWTALKKFGHHVGSVDRGNGKGQDRGGAVGPDKALVDVRTAFRNPHHHGQGQHAAAAKVRDGIGLLKAEFAHPAGVRNGRRRR